MSKKDDKSKKELAFYEKVMAPEKTADGVAVDRVSVYPTGSPHHFRFQIVLVQQQIRKRFAKGYVSFLLTGSLDNKPNQLALNNISSSTRKDLSFSFQYFQVLEGEFLLPDDFIPEQIIVAAVLPKTKWQKRLKLTKEYDWPISTPDNT